jgi:hypothetical protein
MIARVKANQAGWQSPWPVQSSPARCELVEDQGDVEPFGALGKDFTIDFHGMLAYNLFTNTSSSAIPDMALLYRREPCVA